MNITISVLDDVDTFTHSQGEKRIRHTVTCIHLPVVMAPHEEVRPIGLQLPKKAWQAGGRNFSSLQGKIEPGETAVEALRREASEEYSLSRRDIRKIVYFASTLVPVAPDSPKAAKYDAQWLHWYGLSTERNIKPNPKHVTEFGWFKGPDRVFDALSETRAEKIAAISAAVQRAIVLQWLPHEYSTFAELCGSAVTKAA